MATVNPTNQNTPILLPATAAEAAQETRVPLQAYDGPGWTWTPGILNCIWVPMDFATTFAAWVRATTTGDEEGEFDTALRLSGMPLSIFHAFGGAIISLLQLGFLFKESIAQRLEPIIGIIGQPVMLFGIGFCLIQGIYESVCIARAVELISHTESGNLNELNTILQIRDQLELRLRLTAWLTAHPEASLPEEARVLHSQLSAALGANPERLVGDDLWRKALELKDQIILRGLSYFDAEYLSITNSENRHITRLVRRHFAQLSPEEQIQQHTEMTQDLLAVKRANLDRRVRPWCGEVVSSELKGLMQTLRDPHATPEQKQVARANAEEMLQNLDTQAKKRLIIHIVGLVVLTLVAAAFVLTLLACPALIPFILITTAGVLSTFSYIYGAAALDERGWSFSWMKAFETALPPVAWIYSKIAGCCCESQEPEVANELVGIQIV